MSGAGTPRLFVGTTNSAKAQRLRHVVHGWPFECLGPEDLAEPMNPPAESGTSHVEIAADKAVAWSNTTGHLTIASDGGLVIPALGEAWSSLPTKRSTGNSVDDAERLARLMTLMEPYRGEDRRASWAEAVALARGSEVVASWEVEGPTGILAEQPSSTRIDGFWAAALWYFPRFGKAYTELSVDQLAAVGDPWTRLTNRIQGWLRSGGWRRIGGSDFA